MYIRKCDRCGKEQAIKNPMPFFGKNNGQEEGYGPMFTITKNDDFSAITLCHECEEKFVEWLGEQEVP